MDLDTFLTTLYVWIDDWYKAEVDLQQCHGPQPKMSNSEVLTVAIAGQWRSGTPWSSERGVVRYMQREGRQWFPTMLRHSRFNERVRNLWSVIVQLQQHLSEMLRANEDVEIVDCLPLPSCSNGQSYRKGHWLWWGTRGHGGTQSTWYWGDQVLMSVSRNSVISAWLLGPAITDDRAMLQALISLRAGHPEWATPEPWRPWRQMIAPSFITPLRAGHTSHVVRGYLADKGFNGYRWQQHWYERYGISVFTEPPHSISFPSTWKRWFRSIRQTVETVFAVLTTVFQLKQLNAHSRWGQITRLALATAGYNWGIWLNRHMGRPDLSHATIF